MFAEMKLFFRRVFAMKTSIPSILYERKNFKIYKRNLLSFLFPHVMYDETHSPRHQTLFCIFILNMLFPLVVKGFPYIFY